MAASWETRARTVAAIVLAAPSLCLAQSPPPEPIPFQSPMGIVRLQATIADRGPFDLIWDTGAPGPVIDELVAAQLGLKVRDAGTATAAGATPVRVGVAQDVTFVVGGRRLHYDRVQVLPLTERLARYAGRPVHGLLGNDLASRFAVEVDYESRLLRLHDPESFRYDGPGIILPVSGSARTRVRATLRAAGRAPIPGRFLIDTGAAEVTALIISRPFAERHGLAPDDSAGFDEFTAGLSGPVAFRVVSLEALDIHTLSIEAATAAIVGGEAGLLSTDEFDGLITSGLLSRFRVYFDYTRERIVLEPGPASREPFLFGSTGLLLAAAGGGSPEVLVERVSPGSPAGRAGLRAGDVVVTVEGKAATALALEGLLERMRTPEDRISLRVRRGDKMLDLQLTPEAAGRAPGPVSP